MGSILKLTPHSQLSAPQLLPGLEETVKFGDYPGVFRPHATLTQRL
jgi:hypothetical protein